MEKWRLVDLEFTDPYMNLAVEEAIPRMVGEGVVQNTIRFWRNPNAVVIGRFQCMELEVNLDACKKYGTKILRRFTGGGAVYHDYGNLNYAISVNKKHSLIPNDIVETYKIFSAGVVEGLKVLGLRSEFRLPNAIQINGRKISGMAGSLSWGVAFYHGTLVVSSNLSILTEVLNPPKHQLRAGLRGVWSIKEPVITLQHELGKEITTHEVKKALIKGFETAYEIRLVEGELAREERELAHRLYEGKYTKDEWNFER